MVEMVKGRVALEDLVDIAAVGQLGSLGADVAHANADIAGEFTFQGKRVLVGVAVFQIRCESECAAMCPSAHF